MSLDDRIQAYLGATLPADRELVELDGLTASFHPRDPLRYRNWALPGPPPWDLDGLVDAARARQRVPRLEFVESCAPGLPEALEQAGFTREARLDLMTCTPPAHVTLPPPPGVGLEVLAPDAPRETVRTMLAAQRAAFADAGEPDEDDVARYAEVGVLARVDGRVVGGGVLASPRDGLCELAGIGVLEAHRRRGIAGAVTSALAREAFARGVEIAFLTPGDADTRRVYERAGFAATSAVLAYAAGP